MTQLQFKAAAELALKSNTDYATFIATLDDEQTSSYTPEIESVIKPMFIKTTNSSATKDYSKDHKLATTANLPRTIIHQDVYIVESAPVVKKTIDVEIEGKTISQPELLVIVLRSSSGNIEELVINRRTKVATGTGSIMFDQLLDLKPGQYISFKGFENIADTTTFEDENGQLYYHNTTMFIRNTVIIVSAEAFTKQEALNNKLALIKAEQSAKTTAKLEALKAIKQQGLNEDDLAILSKLSW